MQVQQHVDWSQLETFNEHKITKMCTMVTGGGCAESQATSTVLAEPFNQCLANGGNNTVESVFEQCPETCLFKAAESAVIVPSEDDRCEDLPLISRPVTSHRSLEFHTRLSSQLAWSRVCLTLCQDLLLTIHC